MTGSLLPWQPVGWRRWSSHHLDRPALGESAMHPDRVPGQPFEPPL